MAACAVTFMAWHAHLRQPIAEAAGPALLDLVKDGSDVASQHFAMIALGRLAMDDSLCSDVADAALQALTARLQVRRLLQLCLWRDLSQGLRTYPP